MKLLVSSKSIHEEGFIAELQTWPSLMSQLRKNGSKFAVSLKRHILPFVWEMRGNLTAIL